MSKDNSLTNRIPSAIISDIRKMMPCTALFHEAMGRRGNMTPSIKPMAQDTVIVGPARTVKSEPGDNLMLHMALSEAKRSEVIVADCQGHLEYGYWGEFMSSVAMIRGIEGLVIDGGVRDATAIRRMGFGVFARGISVGGTSKRATGILNETITCGGVEVSPGDLILGDYDGVVVVPSNKAAEVLASAKVKAGKEKADLRSILEGRMNYEEFLRKNGWLTGNLARE
jgi:4-hydroxy-4-methyl-2-oxoglutarate aldolase